MHVQSALFAFLSTRHRMLGIMCFKLRVAYDALRLMMR